MSLASLFYGNNWWSGNCIWFAVKFHQERYHILLSVVFTASNSSSDQLQSHKFTAKHPKCASFSRLAVFSCWSCVKSSGSSVSQAQTVWSVAQNDLFVVNWCLCLNQPEKRKSLGCSCQCIWIHPVVINDLLYIHICAAPLLLLTWAQTDWKSIKHLDCV